MSLKSGRLPAMSAWIGVSDSNRMKTLTSEYPLVSQINSETEDQAIVQAHFYINWYLVAFDSEFNLLLAREASKLKDTPLTDLVILIGLTGQAWINQQQRYK